MARRRRAQRSTGSSLASSGANMAGGVALAAADQYLYGSETVSAIVGDGVLKPIINAGVGHFLKRRAPNLGAGIVGVAGYQLGNVLFNSFSGPSEAQGIHNARRYRHRDAGAMHGDPGASFGRPVLAPGINQAFDAGAIFDPAYA